jgi:pimeloyl-ACP methyl ester carboxylesterase
MAREGSVGVEKRTIDGIELAAHMAGEPGARPIVLLHGLTASARDWTLTIKPLTQAGWRVLSPDLPGHGQSSAPKDPAAYGMERVADLAHGLAQALGWAPAVIVGASMGGAVAQEYAIRHPADVAALVLVDSAGDPRQPLPRSPEQADFAEREFALALEQGMQAVWELHQTERGWLYAGGFAPQVQTWRKARFCRTSPEGYLYSDRALADRRKTLPDLARIDCRTLVICCEHEEPFLRVVAEDLAATIPRAEYATIPRAWHSPQIENSRAFNATLLKFLASL